MFGKLGSFAISQNPTMRTGYFGPRALSGLGDVQFDIEGLREHLSRRPMTKVYANGSLSNAQSLISDQLKATNITSSQAYDADLMLADATFEVGSSSDPIPDYVADHVANAVLSALGAANIVSSELAGDVAEKQSTYEFFRDLPSDIGGAVGKFVGSGAKAATDVATSGIWEAIKAFASSPVGLVLLAGAGYLAYRKYAPRTRSVT